MSFWEATKYCLANMKNFEGRATRSEFWWFYLFMSLVSQAVMLVLMVVYFVVMFASLASIDTSEDPESMAGVGWFVGSSVVFYVLIFLFSVVTILMMLAAQVRRLHDVGYSGHWLWLHFAGLGIVPLVFCVLGSQPHANQYGPDPYEGQRAPFYAYPMAGGPGAYGAPGYPAGYAAPGYAAPGYAAPGYPAGYAAPTYAAPPTGQPVAPAQPPAAEQGVEPGGQPPQGA